MRDMNQKSLLFDKIFETSTDAIIVFDEDLRIIKTSQSIHKILGYTEEEMLGNNVKSLIYVKDTAILEKEAKKRQKGHNGDYEIRFVHKDGSILWMRVASSGLFDHDGTFLGGLATISDITEKKRLQREIIGQKKFIETILQKVPEAIAVLDKSHRVVHVNEAFTRLFGYTLDEIQGQNLDDILDKNMEKSANRETTDNVLAGKEIITEGIRYSKDGRAFYAIIKGAPIIIEDELVGAVAIYIDITSQKEYETHLEKVSLHDPMTGLYNRAFFNKKLDILSTSTKDFPLAVIMADMDGLKTINDTLGHLEGDRYIKACAQILKSCSRSSDIVARIGGDEFSILIPNSSEKVAKILIDRIKNATNAYNEKHKLPIPLSISLGFSIAKDPAYLPDKALQEADAMMYRNKAAKKAK
ncbi:MAG: hypothetical protein PWR00_709 [Thermovirga sp.]|nr:hypothetical protein [Thermovirga sp.]